MANNREIAQSVLEAVGGTANVTTVAHCMTRLRFTLKDIDAPDSEKVRSIKGVVGAQISGGQYQVIIGNNVEKVYNELCDLGGFDKLDAINENLDVPEKQPLTPAVIGNRILSYLSGSVNPLIPLLMCAGMFKVISSILGPSMLNLFASDSDVIVLLEMVYEAAFYFMPVYLGYNAAKQLGVTPALGAFIGGILITPTFVSMASAGTAFSVFGIPCTPGTYSKTVLPVLLSVWVMSYIEKGLKKVMPDALTTVFTPVLTVLITLPFALCALAPLGSWIGTVLANIMSFAGEQGGIVAILAGGLIAALWTLIVSTGMHLPIIMVALTPFMETGVDTFIFVATGARMWSFFGAQIGAFLRARGEEKKEILSYAVSSLIGGVGEPFIFGAMFRHTRLFVTQGIGAFVGAVIMLTLGVKYYVMASSNFLSILGFAGGETSNLILAVVASAVAGVVALVLTYLFGFSNKELEEMEK